MKVALEYSSVTTLCSKATKLRDGNPMVYNERLALAFVAPYPVSEKWLTSEIAWYALFNLLIVSVCFNVFRKKYTEEKWLAAFHDCPTPEMEDGIRYESNFYFIVDIDGSVVPYDMGGGSTDSIKKAF